MIKNAKVNCRIFSANAAYVPPARGRALARWTVRPCYCNTNPETRPTSQPRNESIHWINTDCFKGTICDGDCQVQIISASGYFHLNLPFCRATWTKFRWLTNSIRWRNRLRHRHPPILHQQTIQVEICSKGIYQTQ